VQPLCGAGEVQGLGEHLKVTQMAKLHRDSLAAPREGLLHTFKVSNETNSILERRKRSAQYQG
jgi:hypothetical protein